MVLAVNFRKNQMAFAQEESPVQITSINRRFCDRTKEIGCLVKSTAVMLLSFALRQIVDYTSTYSQSNERAALVLSDQDPSIGCIQNLALGYLGSVVTKNPWPFIASSGSCIPQVFGSDPPVPKWVSTEKATFWSSPIVSGDVLYVGADRFVKAFSIDSGQLLWKFDTASLLGQTFPVIDNGKLYATGTSLSEIDTSNGHLIQQYQPAPVLNQYVTVKDGMAYLYGWSSYPLVGLSTLYAIDLSTGHTSWSIPGCLSSATTPTIANGVVYGASDLLTTGSSLMAIESANGNIIWKVSAPGIIMGTFFEVFNGILYYSEIDSQVFAISTTSGTELWEKYIMPKSPIEIFNRTILVGAAHGFASVTMLSLDSGIAIWSCPVSNYVKAPPRGAGDIVYAGSTDGNLYAIDASSGVMLWNFQTSNPIESSPAIGDGVMFFGASHAPLYALPIPSSSSPSHSGPSAQEIGMWTGVAVGSAAFIAGISFFAYRKCQKKLTAANESREPLQASDENKA